MLTDLDSVSREKIHNETEREREITMERGATTRGERDERVGTAVAPAIRDPMRSGCIGCAFPIVDSDEPLHD